jgi:hypothetical protein
MIAIVCPNENVEEVRMVQLFQTVINVLHYDGSVRSETCRSLMSVKIIIVN